MSWFQGESQKIVHLLTEFQTAYIGQNPARVNAQFRNTDTVMILSYAIIMLHTDMYSPNVRPSQKMTREGFVKNLRGVDDGKLEPPSSSQTTDKTRHSNVRTFTN